VIYTVECSFSDPATEAEWNDFYSLEKLPALISVSGFHSSQRFKSLSSGRPAYLAVHSIDDLDVLQSDDYRHKGGGNFARWQAHITDWHRNLYVTPGAVPAVGEGEHLVESELGPGPLLEMGLVPCTLQAVALEKRPEQRWLARLGRAAGSVVGDPPKGIHFYAPMTAQLVSGSPVGRKGARAP